MIITHLYDPDRDQCRGPKIVLNPAHILWAAEEIVSDRCDSPDFFTRVRMQDHEEFVIFMEFQDFEEKVK